MNIDGWLTTRGAAELSGYSAKYLRRLARQGRIDARKVGRDWLINRESLLAYVAEMDCLGPAKHNPWRSTTRGERSGSEERNEQ